MEDIPKERIKFNKQLLNIIRTTMRNNIELTNIADNKANVLLSVNALMLTFLIPLILPHIDIVKAFKLYIPLTILSITCLVTIYMSALVLKPGKFFEKQKEIKKGSYISPFFFGNFYKMGRAEFSQYIQSALANDTMIKNHIIEDLHYIGSRLGQKMSLIRIAFNIFLIGLFGSIIISGLCFLCYGQ